MHAMTSLVVVAAQFRNLVPWYISVARPKTGGVGVRKGMPPAAK
jgi:hypothetical protein